MNSVKITFLLGEAYVHECDIKEEYKFMIFLWDGLGEHLRDNEAVQIVHMYRFNGKARLLD